MSRAQETMPLLSGLKLPWAVITEPAARTDSVIEKDIADALRRCPTLKNDTIDVSVTRGEVKLTGKVKYWDSRRLAGDAAWSVHGVKDVANLLLVEKL